MGGNTGYSAGDTDNPFSGYRSFEQFRSNRKDDSRNSNRISRDVESNKYSGYQRNSSNSYLSSNKYSSGYNSGYNSGGSGYNSGSNFGSDVRKVSNTAVRETPTVTQTLTSNWETTSLPHHQPSDPRQATTATTQVTLPVLPGNHLHHSLHSQDLLLQQ